MVEWREDVEGLVSGNIGRDDEMMKTTATVLLLAFLLDFLLAGCNSARQPLIERIEIDAHVLNFIPTRDDFTVGIAVFTFHCARQATSSEYENEGGRTFKKCCQYWVNNEQPDSPWKYIDLKQVGKNQFQLAPLKVEFSKERSGHLCMSVKVWFNEVSNMWDGMYYENLDDRYSLVSFCTSYEDFDWVNNEARFGQNRVSTLEQFKEALTKPFVIKLNQQPLPYSEKSDGPR